MNTTQVITLSAKDVRRLSFAAGILHGFTTGAVALDVVHAKLGAILEGYGFEGSEPVSLALRS